MTRRSGAAAQVVEGRVIRAQSGFYFVDTPRGLVTATLRGRLKRERQQAGLVALGDLVTLELVNDGGAPGVQAAIVEIKPRSSVLARRAPGTKGVWAQDTIVANIDRLVPVLAAKEPAPHLRMLDRFLALAEIDELESLIVLNKVDLGVPAELRAALAEYGRIGYAVLLTSTVTGQGIEELRSALGDGISALVGPSGTGKSSLLNALEPGLELDTADISTAVHKGRHTTRVGRLLRLSSGGMVADTPGLREIGMWDVDPGELEWAFVELRPYLDECRFDNCTHVHEPDCAVRMAVERGAISAARYHSYCRLLEAG